MRSYLDFEKPVAEIEAKVEELRALAETGDTGGIAEEIARLEGRASAALKDLYADLNPWQKTQVARHPQRPHCLDYVAQLVSNFVPFAGDRKFGDDEAIVGGFGRFRGESVCVIGHEKGSSTESRLKHNFGMARPEGYRNAVRLMAVGDRCDRAGGGGRRAARRPGRDRGGRRRDHGRARRTRGARPRDGPPPASRQVSGHRPNVDLSDFQRKAGAGPSIRLCRITVYHRL